MPEFYVYDVIWDAGNRLHATARASREQIESVLKGHLTASLNKSTGTAAYIVTGRALDGSTLRIVFDMIEGKARPVTAWHAKREK